MVLATKVVDSQSGALVSAAPDGDEVMPNDMAAVFVSVSLWE